jgi:hypothetical protein
MKYAAKVKFSPELRYMHKATVVLTEHAKRKEEDDPALVRYYIPKRQEDMIRAALPKTLQTANIAISRTTIDLTHVLNFYIKTNGEETSFYEGALETDDEAVIDNYNLYRMIKTDGLTKVESFKASDNDAWILTTIQPHQVAASVEQNYIRDMIQVYFIDLPFNKVVKEFEVLV